MKAANVVAVILKFPLRKLARCVLRRPKTRRPALWDNLREEMSERANEGAVQPIRRLGVSTVDIR